MSRVFIGILLLGAGPQTPGDDFFAKGQYAETVQALESLPPPEQTGPVLNRLGIAYHLLGRFKEAEAAYRGALRTDSTATAPRNNLGALFYSQQRFGDADGEFRRAAEHDGDNATLSANLHWSRYARDNQRLAKARAQQLAAERPLLLDPPAGDMLVVISLLPPETRETAWKHEIRGDTYTARKMYEDAVIEYRRALALDKTNAAVANRLGIAYHHLHKYREAERQYREALRLRPNLLDSLINLGVVDYARQDYEGAADRYIKALKLQPTSVTALRNLGACLFSMERWEEGMQVYAEAIRLDPEWFEQQTGGGAGPSIQMSVKATALMNLHFAKLFAGLGKIDIAFSYLDKAVENGLADVSLLRDEQAFKPLAADERFNRILESMAAGRSRI